MNASTSGNGTGRKGTSGCDFQVFTSALRNLSVGVGVGWNLCQPAARTVEP
jgi:hypothetical protein